MLFPSSRAGGVEWIAAFLGNPGPQYEGTRHNAGFMAGAALAKDLGVSVTRLRHRALTATADIGGHKTLLMLPQTYMNLSGEAVGEAARFYKVPPGRVIVVSDEMALPPGVIRVRTGGSAGSRASSPPWGRSSSRSSAWAWASRPTRSTTRRTGCSAALPART